MNTKFYNKYSPSILHIAIANGYYEITKLLIEYGVNVNVTDKDGKTSLYLAIQNGHLEIAKLLRECDPTIDVESAELLFKKLEENKTKFTCHFCLETIQVSYMLNCGHLPFCEKCSKTILEKKVSKCPVCKKSVKERYKAFLESVKFSTSNTEETIAPITID